MPLTRLSLAQKYAVANRLVLFGAGFLLCILWIDLKFDMLLWSYTREVPEAVLAEIAAYYNRVVPTDLQALPLIALVMVITAFASLGQAVRSQRSLLHRIIPLLFAWPPILLALLWIIPSALRIGKRIGTVAEQSAIARAIFWGPVYCFVAMTGLAILEFWEAAADRHGTSRNKADGKSQ